MNGKTCLKPIEFSFSFVHNFTHNVHNCYVMLGGIFFATSGGFGSGKFRSFGHD